MRSLIIALFPLASLAAQKNLEPRLLPVANARLTGSFGSVSGIRQLPNGSLLVNDSQRRQLLLVDPAFAKATVIADSAAGQPNSYGARPGGLIPFVGDSVLFVDPDGLSMFVIDPNGRIARVASIPRPQDAPALAAGTAGIDARGRLVYRGLSRVKQVANGGLTVAQFPDSVSIERIDLATRRVDTAGFIKVSKTNMIVTETEHGMTVAAEVNPVQTVDDWAVLSDGSIAIVRGLDYRVDVVRGNGPLASGSKIPFAWRPLNDEEKVVVLDSAKRGIERMFAGGNGGGAAAMMAMHGGAAPGGMQSHGASPAGGDKAPNNPPPFRLVSASALPDYWPPFGQNAAKADADGRLWIRTSAVRSGVMGSIYDVIDASGTLVDRVQLPPGRQIAGFGRNGVVYLAARDGSGAWLERTTTASSTHSATSDTTGARFIGRWEGVLRTDHSPPGVMTLTVARDSAWKASVEFIMGTQVIPRRVSDFRVDGNDVYWTADVMQMACKVAATLQDKTLEGEADCGHAKLTFTLKKP